MTMVNAVIQDQVGYLYADTALVCTATGNVLTFEPKIFTLTHCPAAIGVTYGGPPRGMEPLSQLDGVMSAHGLQWQLPLTVNAVKARAREMGERNPVLRLVAVCWDSSQWRPRIFISGDGLEEYGVSAGEALEMNFFFGAGGAAADEIRTMIAEKPPNDAAKFDPVKDGIAAFEAARRAEYQPIGVCVAGVHVGGEIHVAEVSGASVACYSIHRWPDDVGKPIAALLLNSDGRASI